MLSNLTALTAARERALPGVAPGRGLPAAGSPSTARPRCTTPSCARRSCSASARAWVRALPIDEQPAAARRRGRRGDRRRPAAGSLPLAVVATAGHDPDRARSTPSTARGRLRRARRVAARRRRLRPAGGGASAVGLCFAARAGGLGLARRAQVAVPAQGLRRRARARRARRSRGAFGHEEGYLLHDAARAARLPTSRSSTRGRSGRSSSGSRFACTALRVPRRASSATSAGAAALRRDRAGTTTWSRSSPPQLSIVPFRHGRPAWSTSTRTTAARPGASWPTASSGGARRHRRPHLPPALHRELPHEPTTTCSPSSTRSRQSAGRSSRLGGDGRRGLEGTVSPGGRCPIGPDEAVPTGRSAGSSSTAARSVSRRLPAQWAAFDDTCTHQEELLARGRGARRRGRGLPCHGSSFDVLTGDVLSPPRSTRCRFTRCGSTARRSRCGSPLSGGVAGGRRAAE